jgi:hypothetical protein
MHQQWNSSSLIKAAGTWKPSKYTGLFPFGRNPLHNSLIKSWAFTMLDAQLAKG